MITQSDTRKQKEKWQIELTQAFTVTTTLLKYCGHDVASQRQLLDNNPNFRCFVTKSWADRIEKGNIYDPMLLQVMSQSQENVITPGYNNDPLIEAAQTPTPGLIHKYHGRALVTLTGNCAINCRYCFRRAFPYQENNFNKQNWQGIITYLKNNHDIYEVILSGGDPLLMKDNIIAGIIADLDSIPHLRYLRIHSRVPLALPSRITDKLIAVLLTSRLLKTIVIHSNCPQEIDTEVQDKLLAIKSSGINLLNQSVLLKDINNNAMVLAELSHKLFAAGVMPYYIHKLDKVSGSAHFNIPLATANTIMQQLIELLPGYLMPKFVKEQGFAKSKIPISFWNDQQ